jgi:O-antigen ligase
MVRAARTVRLASRLLEAVLWLAVVGSCVALGAVHSWAYVPLWSGAAVCAVLILLRSLLLLRLRDHFGPTRIVLDSAAGTLRADRRPQAGRGLGEWSVDLAMPAGPHGPLIVPGIAMVGWASLQLIPLPPAWKAWTVSPSDTMRGLAFVASVLAFHAAAATVFVERATRERFRRTVAGLGFVAALVALAQLASGTPRIYGLIEPVEHGAVFGPFVNRNHFAGYMLMVTPLCLAILARDWASWRRSLGERGGWRRRLLSLSAPEGTRVLLAALPALAAISSLVATTSRGALCAFAVSLALAGLQAWRRRAVPAWVLGLAFTAMGAGWFGFERLEARFGQLADNAPGRTRVWAATLERLDGRWLTGWGLDTFEWAFSRVEPFVLPEGATPWPAALLAEAAATRGRPGFRALTEERGPRWYREAHNDYLQLLFETGVPGLLLGLWGAVSALRAARRNPWLLAAVAGVLLHALVEFDFQIPAIAVLFAAIVALAGATSTAAGGHALTEARESRHRADTRR